MTVGQEFHAWAASLESEIAVLREAEKHLYTVNMGATAIGSGINVPDGYAEEERGAPREAHRQADRAGDRHVRRHMGPAGVRRLFLGAQERRHQDVEDRRRPDPARLRAARRPGRDQPSGDAAGLVDHAGQGESGDPGARQPRGVPRDGERLHRHAGRPFRPAAAQRVRADRRAGRDGIAAPALHHVADAAHVQCIDGITREREGARRTTWTPPSASSRPSTRYWATRRRPSWPTKRTRAARASSRSSARRSC